MSDAALITILVAWFALFFVGAWLIGHMISDTLEIRWRRHAGLPPKDEDDTRAGS